MKLCEKYKARYNYLLKYILNKYPELNDDIVLQDCFAVIDEDGENDAGDVWLKAYTALLRLRILKLRKQKIKNSNGKNN